MPQDFDYLLVGGGLQNALIAMALRVRRPDARVAIVERSLSLGGNHLWCFHAQDVAEGAEEFVAPLVAHAWDGYDVRFPSYDRHFDSRYSAISSEKLDAVVSRQLSAPGCAAFMGVGASSVSAHEVQLSNGRTLRGRVVVDARGPERLAVPSGRTGYQKFVGLEVELPSPHGRAQPLLMDATVEQCDGFRFVYALPLSATRLLIEDTYFSDTPSLEVAQIRGRALQWAEKAGLPDGAIVREETGVLPLPYDVPRVEVVAPLRAGYAGGWFHPTTGYSLPVAVRLADHVSRTSPEDLFGGAFSKLVETHQRQLRLAALLNQAMFGAFAPESRRNVFEHFHHLPEPLIARFYALQLSPADVLQIGRHGPPPGFSWARMIRHAASGIRRAAA